MGSTTDKLKGKLKRAEGAITNDKIREAQGWAEEKKGEVEGAVERAADKVERTADKVADKIDEKLDRKIDKAHRDNENPNPDDNDRR